MAAARVSIGRRHENPLSFTSSPKAATWGVKSPDPSTGDGSRARLGQRCSHEWPLNKAVRSCGHEVKKPEITGQGQCAESRRNDLVEEHDQGQVIEVHRIADP